jgi:thioredoxin-dependent peroxiredoxin
VLAFYPRDFTSGCTAELRTFTDQYDVLFGDGVEVVGISVDSLTTHVSFAASLKAPFKLLSDPAQAVARKYGSHGSQGTMRRTVYVIDGEGRITYRNLRFGALDRRSYDELKAAVREARGS